MVNRIELEAAIKKNYSNAREEEVHILAISTDSPKMDVTVTVISSIITCGLWTGAYWFSDQLVTISLRPLLNNLAIRGTQV